MVFTIGMDDVTGQADVVSWSPSIEHKTEFSSTSERKMGYPDPGYLDRLFRQLEALGVADQEEEQRDEVGTTSDV